MRSPGAQLAPVTEVLERGRREGVAPALSATVLFRGGLVHASDIGEAQVEPEARPLAPGTLFDVASLTKVMAATTLAALLVAAREITLDDRVARFLPGFAGGGRETVTVRHLLAHASGLPAWRPYFEAAMRDPVAGLAFLPPAQRPASRLGEAFARGRSIVRAAVLAEGLEAPPGARALYSDPGFMLLGWVLEKAGGGGLDELCRDRVFAPLALADTLFVDEQAEAHPGGALPMRREGREFAATERCEHRGEVNRGSVNDDNAWAMGGVAGHAGLFSTARDAAALGQAWLDALRGRPSPVDAHVAATFARRDGAPGSTRALGWDTPSAEGSSLGTRLGRGPRGAIGHLGFTGGSLWIDVDREVVAALLTNRCHPSRENERIKAFRPRFHDAVAAALGI
jgi:CubicO group peptidase (beta-lactamase class C family)